MGPAWDLTIGIEGARIWPCERRPGRDVTHLDLSRSSNNRHVKPHEKAGVSNSPPIFPTVYVIVKVLFWEFRIISGKFTYETLFMKQMSIFSWYVVNCVGLYSLLSPIEYDGCISISAVE